jgi:hypothetical protein
MNDQPLNENTDAVGNNTPVQIPPMEEVGTIQPATRNNSNRIFWMIMGVIIVTGSILFVFITRFFVDTINTLAATPTLAPTRIATITPTSTFTPTPNLTATQQVVYSGLTAEAFQATTSVGIRQWPVKILDSFDSNALNWQTGNDNNEYAALDRQIVNGRYRWNVTARSGFVRWVYLPIELSLKTFFVAVDLKMDSNQLTEGGLLFRINTKGNYYFFELSNAEQYGLFYYDGSWTPLINWTNSSLIHSDTSNRIAVVGEENHFLLFINGQFVAEAFDDNSKMGSIAMAVSLRNANDHAIYEFDNFEIRAP